MSVKNALRGTILAATALALPVLANGCSAANTVGGALSGCSEFSSGASAIAGLKLDANTNAFVSAAQDFVGVSTSLETAVLNACIGIDKDLGVTDTWTAMAPTNGGAPDAELTEACKQAQTKIQAVLNAAATANVSCALSISGGQCTVDASVQASCEANCTGAASCQPGDVTVRCDPGNLSVQCSGTCNAGATCEGSVTAPVVNCQGTCSADCSGECDATPGTAPSIQCQGSCSGKCTGSCVASAGTTQVTGAACTGQCNGTCDANCTYTSGQAPKVHCAGTCKGGCTGNCTITPGSAGISCGASVSCKGGCTGTATAPKCEGEIKPPSCNIDANCEASCQGHAEAKASCTPPTVTLDCGANATADVQALITTLGKNLPAILAAVQQQGKLAVTAAGHVASAGAAVVSNITSAGGKALACASAAVQASASASVSVNVSVQASASVSGSAGGPSS